MFNLSYVLLNDLRCFSWVDMGTKTLFSLKRYGYNFNWTSKHVAMYLSLIRKDTNLFMYKALESVTGYCCFFGKSWRLTCILQIRVMCGANTPTCCHSTNTCFVWNYMSRSPLFKRYILWLIKVLSTHLEFYYM